MSLSPAVACSAEFQRHLHRDLRYILARPSLSPPHSLESDTAQPGASVCLIATENTRGSERERVRFNTKLERVRDRLLDYSRSSSVKSREKML